MNKKPSRQQRLKSMRASRAVSGGLASTVSVLADTDDYDNPALSLARAVITNVLPRHKPVQQLPSLLHSWLDVDEPF